MKRLLVVMVPIFLSMAARVAFCDDSSDAKQMVQYFLSEKSDEMRATANLVDNVYVNLDNYADKVVQLLNSYEADREFASFLVLLNPTRPVFKSQDGKDNSFVGVAMDAARKTFNPSNNKNDMQRGLDNVNNSNGVFNIFQSIPFLGIVSNVLSAVNSIFRVQSDNSDQQRGDVPAKMASFETALADFIKLYGDLDSENQDFSAALDQVEADVNQNSQSFISLLNQVHQTLTKHQVDKTTPPLDAIDHFGLPLLKAGDVVTLDQYKKYMDNKADIAVLLSLQKINTDTVALLAKIDYVRETSFDKLINTLKQFQKDHGAEVSSNFTDALGTIDMHRSKIQGDINSVRAAMAGQDPTKPASNVAAVFAIKAASYSALKNSITLMRANLKLK